ncbi:MAG TPA: gamma-glutamyl-gamma-aminobutyrate hydrolase family protein [Puia sp.]|jgi:putative glutamine amidotransferase|nr:gamma-glutamyl-gamma-aminobutyrate hydrolase family protein [Puia sp.]
MIKIGLTDTGTEWKHQNYVRWIKGLAPDRTMRPAGGETGAIEVIRLSAALGNLNEAAGCDGLVLSGGIDIDPALYGGASEYKRSPVAGWERERDLFEQAVLRMAWERDLPVLGVCRGLQLINVTLKGSLVQDLGIGGDAVHEANAGIDKEHGVRIEEGSLLAAVVEHSSGEVNSAHHQAVDRLGEGLRVNCYAEDGTIEGIEWAKPEGRPFLLAVQWHPERMLVNGMDNEFLYWAIRDRFVREVGGY